MTDEGLVTANTVDGDRANITLDADLIILGDRSQITTNAIGSATGGNLDIDTRILTAFNNSDITANAVESQGGNIQILAQSVLGIQPREALTPFSDITASSRFGLDGTIVIESPDVEPEQGLLELSSNMVDVTQLIAQECRQDDQLAYSQFSVSGRGGVPSHPAGLLNRRTILASPSRPIGVTGVTQSAPTNIAPGFIAVSTAIPSSTETISPITEARGWSVTPDGQVTLAADTQTAVVRAYIPWHPSKNCNVL
ncbi:MAG: S-layer family protein [Cyanobacteria bacterium P01_F01_bin.150]